MYIQDVVCKVFVPHTHSLVIPPPSPTIPLSTLPLFHSLATHAPSQALPLCITTILPRPPTLFHPPTHQSPCHYTQPQSIQPLPLLPPARPYSLPNLIPPSHSLSYTFLSPCHALSPSLRRIVKEEVTRT
ncbi:hypothetical protein Pcinc_009407 [Petrolisthes cinctipes]|uniref:Uncharacterized protein n=1 Tax=Petrolisthes cinctipes TaxID=88211 RepID=A0AAE1KWH6_PETCI|nr:hypothetical protein Pcinc_009407 [Petrolisthes cinctipes]